MKKGKGKSKGISGKYEALVVGAKFVLVFAIVFAALVYAGQGIGIDRQLAQFDAGASAMLLNALGQKAELFYAGDWPSIAFGGFNAQINYLCTGLLELSVLVAAIIASLGISWRKRAIGIVLGVLAGIAFNVFRIVATSLALLYSGTQTAELAHDLLFRLSIIFVVAGIYFVWFRFALKRDISGKNFRKKNGVEKK